MSKMRMLILKELRKIQVVKPTGDCIKCDEKEVRIVKDMCPRCYQADYIKKRNEERSKYLF